MANSRSRSKQPRILKRGINAIEAARKGRPLYVFNPQRGWVACDAKLVLARAARMEPHSLWIYGSA